MRNQNFNNALNQSGSTKYFDTLEQGKKYNPWTMLVFGVAMWIIMLVIAFCILKAKADKNNQYQQAQIENSKQA